MNLSFIRIFRLTCAQIINEAELHSCSIGCTPTVHLEFFSSLIFSASESEGVAASLVQQSHFHLLPFLPCLILLLITDISPHLNLHFLCPITSHFLSLSHSSPALSPSNPPFGLILFVCVYVKIFEP